MQNRFNRSILYLSHFMTDLYASLLTPILPLLTQKLGINVVQISVIMSLSYIGSSFLQPVFGNIADNSKKCNFIIAGMICTCLFSGIIGYTQNLITFALFVILINLGEGLFHPQATILSNILSNENNKGNTMGLYIAAGLIGFSAGPLLSGYISDVYGILNLKYLSLFAIFAIFFISLSLSKVRYSVNDKETGCNLLSSFVEIIKNRSLLSLMFLSVSRPLILITFCIYVPFLLSEKNFSSYQIGIVICIFQLAGALGAFVGGKLYDKMNKILLFAFSLISTTVLVVSSLLLFEKNTYLFLFLYFAASFTVNINSGINILIAQSIDKYNMGMLGGILNGFNWWIAGFSLSAVGVLINMFGINNVLIFLGFMPLISMLLLFFVKTENN